MPISFQNTPPLVEEFISMRSAEGWGNMSEETARASLMGGLINLSAYEDGKLVGFGRVLGDGKLYFYVQDLIVAPAFRGRGYGCQIMDALLAETGKIAAPGAVICLMAASGKEAFYESLGFVARPTPNLGAGMMLRL